MFASNVLHIFSECNLLLIVDVPILLIDIALVFRSNISNAEYKQFELCKKALVVNNVHTLLCLVVVFI